MESVKFDRERGQILVQVALMVVALFAFVALALDVGHVYAGRRRMQNAADAGALAGAREICFGGHDSLEAAQNRALQLAEQYAIERNGAHAATVEILDDYTVTVDARQTLDTFFAGVIGINTAPVRAQAAAACGSLVSTGAWPLAFDLNVFSDTVECGQKFLVFDDALDCAGPDDNCTPENCSDDNCCNKLNCDLISDPYMGTGQYGWLDLPEPEEEDMPDHKQGECGGTGANWMRCWIKYDYPPLIENGDCIPTESGIMDTVGKTANERMEDEDPLYVNIILWEEWCEERVIRVAGVGCIKVLGYFKDWSIPKCNGADAGHKVIYAERMCPEGPEDDGYDRCVSFEGTTLGGGDRSQSRGVSLIQWPPADQ